MSRHLRIAIVALAMGACGEPADDGASVPGEPVGDAKLETAGATEPALENSAGLSLTCAAPFTPDATAATLAAAFAAKNVIPETIDGPEDEKLNVTAIYPDDPAKRIEVYFKDEEARTGLAWAVVKEEASVWSGPAGVRIGDSVGKVQDANGAVFEISGWGWDYGGTVVDWKGGRLEDTASGCRAMIRFRKDPANNDKSILGETPHASDEPAVRAANPEVAEFSIRW